MSGEEKPFTTEEIGHLPRYAEMMAVKWHRGNFAQSWGPDDIPFARVYGQDVEIEVKGENCHEIADMIGWLPRMIATINALRAQLEQLSIERDNFRQGEWDAMSQVAAAVEAIERERSELESQRHFLKSLCYTCKKNRETKEAGLIGSVACPHPMSVREKELTDLLKDLSTTAEAYTERVRAEERERIIDELLKEKRKFTPMAYLPDENKEFASSYRNGFGRAIMTIESLQPAASSTTQEEMQKAAEGPKEVEA